MARRKIELGQIWIQDVTGDRYLLTKLYNEVLSTIVVMRKVGAEQEVSLKVKARWSSEGLTLPGFTLTQDSMVI